MHQQGILKVTLVRKLLKPIYKMEAVAKLNNYPTSPRKMRLLADLVRGMEVDKALGILQFNPMHSSIPLYKLLNSAINNWSQKNPDTKVEDANLAVKTIMVDCGRVIKRMRPAPQGRGYRVRKRSNHVTVIVDTKLVKQTEKEKNKIVRLSKSKKAVPAVVPTKAAAKASTKAADKATTEGTTK